MAAAHPGGVQARSSSRREVYHLLKVSGSASPGVEAEEAGHLKTCRNIRAALVEDFAEGQQYPRWRGLHCGVHSLLATLLVAALVAWMGFRGRGLWSHRMGSQLDPTSTVVHEEVSPWVVGKASLAAFRKLPSTGTSPWVPEPCQLPASHTRCPEMKANMEYTFDDAAPAWTKEIRHVKGPDKCCAMCQGTKHCTVWSWVKNAGPFENWYVCFLKGGTPSGKRATNGIISGRPPPRLRVKQQEKAAGPDGVSLYCFSLMRPDSYEVDLLNAQQVHGAGIFACNECMVYSNQAIRIGSLTASIVNSDLKCTAGGDFGKALNSWIFIEVWRKVIENNRWYHHDWTVKADPDAVLFPSHLQRILLDHREAGYVNNCQDGMHGAIEVLSKKAVGALAWDYRRSHNKTYPRHCVAAQELSRWGEDMFLDKCLKDTLNVRREFDVRLLCEGSCGCPDWYWCQNGTTRAAFHPFKAADPFVNCVANALGGGAQRMPPTPEPCAKAKKQCGGTGWRGPKCCEQGYECRQNNTWYSQCQPECGKPLAQCGGKAWKGVTCCKGGYECREKDEWYSQCQPPWAPDNGRSSNTSQSSSNADQSRSQADRSSGTTTCAEALGQCGGHSYKGPRCCASGYHCLRKNKWYSQCKPEGSPEPVRHRESLFHKVKASHTAACAGPDQQCGGIGYEGSSCCTSGYVCAEKNHWYSACSRPAAEA